MRNFFLTVLVLFALFLLCCGPMIAAVAFDLIAM